MKLSSPIVVASALVCASFATGPQEPARRSETAPESQLDFWVGDWDATYRMRTGPGTDAWKDGRARNSIKKVHDGKVVLEEFDDSGPDGSGLTGMSVSVYNAANGGWRQTWVDNQSGYIDLAGKFEDGKMFFATERTVGGKKQISRMVFENIEKDSFDWTWMSSADEGKTWVDNWIIHYKRRGS